MIKKYGARSAPQSLAAGPQDVDPRRNPDAPPHDHEGLHASRNGSRAGRGRLARAHDALGLEITRDAAPGRGAVCAPSPTRQDPGPRPTDGFRGPGACPPPTRAFRPPRRSPGFFPFRLEIIKREKKQPEEKQLGEAGMPTTACRRTSRRDRQGAAPGTGAQAPSIWRMDFTGDTGVAGLRERSERRLALSLIVVRSKGGRVGCSAARPVRSTGRRHLRNLSRVARRLFLRVAR